MKDDLGYSGQPKPTVVHDAKTEKAQASAARSRANAAPEADLATVRAGAVPDGSEDMAARQ